MYSAEDNITGTNNLKPRPITKIDTDFFKYAQTPLAPVGAIIDDNKINFKLIIKINFKYLPR